MLVGTKNINMSELKKACDTEDSLLRYTLKLVPLPMKHMQAVISNQKYLIALNVRTIISIPWKRRKGLCEYILRGVVIKGAVDAIYDYQDLLEEIDVDIFKELLNAEK